MDEQVNALVANCFNQNSNNHDALKHMLNEITEKFKKNEISLEVIVVSLGSYLTSPKVDDRFKGLQILCNFIELPTNEKLTTIEVDYLCEFLINRLKDHHTFIPLVTKTLLLLIKSFGISSNQAQNLFSSINKEISVQQLKASERFVIYQIIGHLVKHHLEIFKAINFDFLYGFLQIIEGERDPRCLLLSFNLFKMVAENFNLGHLDEEMFEVISCYFPIVYRPIGEKSYCITREELHDSLKECFVSNLAFAPFLLALLLEKLESEVESAKFDCYDVLAQTKMYNSSILKDFLASFWNCIRLDCLKAKKSKTSVIAISAIKTLLKSIESDELVAKDFVSTIINDMEPAILKHSLQLFESAIDILDAVGSVSCFYQKMISDSVFPKIINDIPLYSSTNQTQAVKGLIQFFNSFQKMQTIQSRLLVQDTLLLLLLNFLHSTDQKLSYTALQCLNSFLLTPYELSTEEKSAIAQNILILLSSDEQNNDEMIKGSRNILKTFGVKCPAVTKAMIVPKLFDSIQYLTSVHEELDANQMNRIQASFLALRQLQLETIDVNKCIEAINNLLNLEKNHSTIFIESIIQSLIDTINSSNLQIFLDSFIIPLFDQILKDSNNKITFSLHHFKIVEAIMVKSKVIDKSILGNVLKFLNLITSNCDGLPTCSEGGFHLIHCILCNTIFTDDQEANLLFSQLLTLFKANEQERAKLILEMIESLLNKSNQVMAEHLCQVEQLIESNLVNPKEKAKAVLLLLAVNRALVIRGCDDNIKFTQKLLYLLETEEDLELIELISKQFVPAHQNYKHLSLEANANVFPFYQQKYYIQTSNQLYKSYKDQDYPTWRRKGFALCLLNHLKNLPEVVIKSEAKKLQSLILISLKDEESIGNQHIALDCIKYLLEINSSSIQNDLTSISDSLLRISKNKLSFQIRKKALESLATVASTFDEIVTLPLREKVIKQLKLSLDDPKRLVRNSAYAAIHKWILIGQPS